MSDRRSVRPRSVLFAPALRADLVRKMPRTGADVVVIDCEDAVARSHKAEGREAALGLATELVEGGSCVFIRVNEVASEWFEQDMQMCAATPQVGVVVPKVDSERHLVRVAELLPDVADRPVMAGFETVRGVADARMLLDHPVVDLAYFGAEDFIADLGGRRTTSNHEVSTARSLVSMAARLAGVAVVDQIVADHRDAERFVAESSEARDMGYGGKLCIHPGQVELANVAFLPTKAELEDAEQVLALYQEASTDGVGVASRNGEMIDAPMVAQAQSIVQLWNEHHGG